MRKRETETGTDPLARYILFPLPNVVGTEKGGMLVCDAELREGVLLLLLRRREKALRVARRLEFIRPKTDDR